ncbi:MAG: succinylglutamate desuccinylase [Lachnospiraceae bacterium]|nr:succinylglutamate desuccinylase [Lachnospiraceae bacterium]
MTKKKWIPAVIILAIAAVVGGVAAASFIAKRNFVEDIYEGEGVTSTFTLSEYNENLEGTVADATVYVLQGEEEGASLLVLGGTHPNEPSGHMAAILLEENATVEVGTIYVITNVNNSAFTHNDPLEGSPQYINFTTSTGETRTFHYGSRATNPIDQWPDPDIYTHSSGQTLSGSETRNLNRCYPGIEDGTITEQVAYAVTTMIQELDITMTIDLHESSPEYSVNNATVAHENAMSIASEGVLNLQLEGISMSLEPSPVSLHGLTHRELGDFTNTYALLMETGNPSQGRLRGATNEELVLTGEDPCYEIAYDLGLLYVDYSSGSLPIETRVGRHLQGIIEYINALNNNSEDQLVVTGIPTYDELTADGVSLGDFLL